MRALLAMGQGLYRHSRQVTRQTKFGPASEGRAAPAIAQPMSPAVKFVNVCRHFGPVRAVDGVTLDIAEGEFFAMLGPSGSGKTTCLRLIAGFEQPTEGHIEIFGETAEGVPPYRRNVNTVFQDYALFPHMTVGENVAYGLEEHFRDTMSLNDRRDRVAWALDLVGLPGIEDMDPADLSGGMRKRVALARSIAVQPEVVLYDEPTTGLDPINTARVNHLIMGLQRRLSITSIVVTHDMKSAFTISDRIAMVHGGRIIYQGTPRDFRAASDSRIADFIEGRAPVNEDVETLLKA